MVPAQNNLSKGMGHIRSVPMVRRMGSTVAVATKLFHNIICDHCDI